MRKSRNAASCVLRRFALAGTLALAMPLAVLSAPPVYNISKVFVPEYELDVPFVAAAPSGYTKTPVSAAVYKPHEVAVDSARNIWVVSNERGEHGNEGSFNADGTRVGQFRAGITIFKMLDNQVAAKLIIDEPMFAPGAPAGNPNAGPVTDPYTSSTGFLYHGMDLEGAVVEPPVKGKKPPPEEEEEGGECPTRPVGAPGFIQTVFLPIVLPPNSVFNPDTHGFPADPLGRQDYDGHTLKIGGTDAEGRPIYVGHDVYGRPAVMSPMGAECHARHPHGIDFDKARKLIYQLIEHSGLRWNADRTDFLPAATTDEEAGSALVYDVSDPAKPRILTGYIFGHGAHELAVDEVSGWVWQGNHENSPGVMPPNWTDVIDPGVMAASASRSMGPYGFIDTGFFQALQDIEVDESARTVYNVSHVGQRMYAFNADAFPAPNAQIIYEDDPLTGFTEAYPTQQWGRNSIRYWVDLRAPWNAFWGSVATKIFSTIDVKKPRSCLASVLHFHNLAVDATNKVVYNGLHSIHHAEHTGLPAEQECAEATTEAPAPGEEENEPIHHYNGRDVVGVDVKNQNSFTINPATLQATNAPTFVIDMSNGYGYLQYPNVEDVIGAPTTLAEAIVAVDRLERSFVHGHWLTMDARTRTLLVTGEHTGNLGVVDVATRNLVQVLPVSVFNPDLANSPSSDCEVGEDGIPDDLEPHAHGVQVDPQSGKLFVSDEGEHCFYESVTIVTP